MSSQPCPKCGSPQEITYGSDGRRFYVCSSETCPFNYKNISKDVVGKNRRHFKLSKEDYVEIHEQFEDCTIGQLSRRWGVSRKQIKRILNLNLSKYAEDKFGEPHINES